MLTEDTNAADPTYFVARNPCLSSAPSRRDGRTVFSTTEKVEWEFDAHRGEPESIMNTRGRDTRHPLARPCPLVWIASATEPEVWESVLIGTYPLYRK